MKKILTLILLITFFSCTDLLTNETEYHSIELKGNGWVQINQTTNFNADNFTLQAWFSGSDTEISSAQTILSMISPSGNILIGIFKNPIYENRLDIWIDNSLIDTIELPYELANINSFNLITVKSDVSTLDSSLISIDIFINKTKILSENTSLDTLEIQGIDFIIGGKVNNTHTYRDSFWYGCIDEIRLWNEALADTIIEYHNDYPDKLSFEADTLTYNEYLQELSGLWRFYAQEDTYSTVPNEACSTIDRLRTHLSCELENTDTEAIIYTFGSNIEFSEKHK